MKLLTTIIIGAITIKSALAATAILPSVSNLPNTQTNPVPGGFEIKNQFITAHILTPHPATGHSYPMITKLWLLGTEVVPNDNAGANVGYALRRFDVGRNYNPTLGGDCAGNTSSLLDFRFDTATLNSDINWLPAGIGGSPAMGMKIDVMPRTYGSDDDSVCRLNFGTNIAPRIDIDDPSRNTKGRGAQFENFMFTFGTVLGSDGSQDPAYPNNGIHPLGMLLDFTIQKLNHDDGVTFYNKRLIETPTIFTNNIWRYAFMGKWDSNKTSFSIFRIGPNNGDTTLWQNNITQTSDNSGVNLAALCIGPDPITSTCMAIYSETPVHSEIGRRNNLTLVSLNAASQFEYNAGADKINDLNPKKFRRMIAFGNQGTFLSVIQQSRTAGHFTNQ